MSDDSNAKQSIMKNFENSGQDIKPCFTENAITDVDIIFLLHVA